VLRFCFIRFVALLLCFADLRLDSHIHTVNVIVRLNSCECVWL
jgi:hypothetical protein